MRACRGSLAFTQIGGEFMPALEEGNLWIRATMQQDIAFPQSAELADQIRSSAAHAIPR